MVEDLDFAVLPYPVGKSEIVCFRWILHFGTFRLVKGLFCEAQPYQREANLRRSDEAAEGT